MTVKCFFVQLAQTKFSFPQTLATSQCTSVQRAQKPFCWSTFNAPGLSGTGLKKEEFLNLTSRKANSETWKEGQLGSEQLPWNFAHMCAG